MKWWGLIRSWVPEENRTFGKSIGNVLQSFFRCRRRENICPERRKFQCHFRPRLMQLLTLKRRYEMWLNVYVTHRQGRWKSFADILKRVCSDFEAPFFFFFFWFFFERLLSQRESEIVFQQKGFCRSWQFVTTYGNKESAASINQIVVRFLCPELVVADLFVIVALQEFWGILRRCISSG